MNHFALGLTVLLAVASIAIGAGYLAAPVGMTRSFGLPLPEAGVNTSWWLRLKGVRDTASGLLLLTFMVWGTPHDVGLMLLVQTVIPLGDMTLVLAAKGSTRSALAIHFSTAVVMACTAFTLLLGGH